MSKGDIVNVALPNIPENVYILYGLNKLGAIANLIDLRSKGENLLHYLTETSATISVVCDLFFDNTFEILDKTGIKKMIIVSAYDSIKWPVREVLKAKTKYKTNDNCIKWQDFLKLAKLSEAESPAIGSFEDTAVILHTSGTTGTPKGVMLPNRVFNAMVNQVSDCGMIYRKGERFLNQVPPFLAYNVLSALNDPLLMGLHVIMIPTYEPEKFSETVYKYKANHVVAGPADWKSFLSNEKVKTRDYSFLKTLISGSDKIDEADKEKVNLLLNSCGCGEKILEGYGMTEVGAAAVMNLPQIIVPNSVGIPLKNALVSIFDTETDLELKYDETGEICISGPIIMSGYYNNQEETDNTIRLHPDGSRWIHTGDLGHMNKDGCLFLVGRLKRIIVRHDGIKVSPYTIENVIMNSGLVKECCVIGGTDKEKGYGQIPVAFVVTDNPNDVENLKFICTQELSEIYRPKEIKMIDRIPLTGTGKIDYRSLEKIFDIGALQ